MSTISLTPQQKQTVAAWVAAGDNLSAIQKKLSQEFGVSMTYMDVRFLVDDLNLDLKDPAPKAEASSALDKPQDAPAAKKGFLDKAKEKLGLGRQDEEGGSSEDAFDQEPEQPAGGSGVSVTVDKVTLHPGALASGTVTFSDGVTGRWLVDNYGRPALAELSKPGYRPSAADAQGFVEELNLALQRRGL